MNKYFPRKKLAILALAVPVAMGLPLQATAQDSDLEEVIVTSQKRSENLTIKSDNLSL